MFKVCRDCYSIEFRLSQFRAVDIWRLFLLMYPVRCRDCGRRAYTILPLALLYKIKADKIKTEKAPSIEA